MIAFPASNVVMQLAQVVPHAAWNCEHPHPPSASLHALVLVRDPFLSTSQRSLNLHCQNSRAGTSCTPLLRNHRPWQTGVVTFPELTGHSKQLRRFCAPQQQTRKTMRGQVHTDERRGLFRQNRDETGVSLHCPHGKLVTRAGSIDDNPQSRSQYWVCCCSDKELNGTEERALDVDEKGEKPGVKYALVLLQFYKNEISPYLPGSCRYLPTCSVYAQEAYKKYGVWKGTILTMWRLARCNPFGGTGFDPPRWFDEERPPSV